MTLIIKGYQRYYKSKLKVQFLSKFSRFNFDLFLIPLKVQSHTVPHWKGLTSGKYEPKGLRSRRVLKTIKLAISIVF